MLCRVCDNVWHDGDLNAEGDIKNPDCPWCKITRLTEEKVRLGGLVCDKDTEISVLEGVVSELKLQLAAAKAVMEEVGSMPGRDWLAGQLKLAEYLYPTTKKDKYA